MVLSVMLVEDHVLVREALRVSVNRDPQLHVVAEAGDGATALRLAAEHIPDVVLVDLFLPDCSGSELTHRLLAHHPALKILVVSAHLDRHVVQHMLDAGASGYVSKSATLPELARGIRAVHEGQPFFCAKTASLLTPSPHPAPETNILSPREIEVLTLLAKGHSGPDIAASLGIALRTVDVHRRNIMRKTALRNVVELTHYAIRAGFVPLHW